MILRTILVAAVFTVALLGTPAVRAETAPPVVYNVDAILRAVPDGSRWLQHLTQDLLPFWTMPTALGQPVGNFPTYRCNDGSLYDAARPCPELRAPIPGIVNLDREYMRMRGRQVYAYGVAFHMTGNKLYLVYAKAGLDDLMKRARESSGAFVSYFSGRDAVPGPAPAQRVSQDMAYAITAPAFYYYLTRDPVVLRELEQTIDYVFKTYYDRALDRIAWVKETSPDGDSPDQIELVAQLDQVYAYLLWTTPALPEGKQAPYREWLRHLAHIMVEQFWSPRIGLFWGQLTTPAIKQLGQPHDDFGHSVKALWLIYQIGKLTNDLALMDFARTHAARVLEMAFIPEDGTWARRYDETGKLDKDKEWWILAELDQVAATLALIDPAYARYLPTTYAYWFDTMVDHQYGEIWHWVDAATNKPNIRFPKQHSWKNALHSFEHALVGYLTGQQLHGQPVVLHYAFKDAVPPPTEIQPYFFEGKVLSIEAKDGVHTVTFTGLR
jgi:mannose/cellobiose epimerase-like protein (N-acyl-D-glucosamine 2-epimerase family)